MGGLRLDSREGLLKGGKSGPAIVPGDPDKSLLIQAVRQTRRAEDAEGRSPEAGGDRRAGGMGEGGRDLAHLRAEFDRHGSLARRCGGQTRLWRLRVERSGLRHHAGTARVLVVPADSCRAGAGGVACVVAEDRHRPLHARASRARGAGAGARGRQAHADPPRDARSDRPAADARGDRGVRAGRVARRVREGGRSPARLAALRRALGPALARRRALRRGRLPLARPEAARLQPVPERLPVSRLGDQGVQRRPAVRPVRQARSWPATCSATRRRARARCPRSASSASVPGSTTTARSKSRAPTSGTIASTWCRAASSA